MSVSAYSFREKDVVAVTVKVIILVSQDSLHKEVKEGVRGKNRREIYHASYRFISPYFGKRAKTLKNRLQGHARVLLNACLEILKMEDIVRRYEIYVCVCVCVCVCVVVCGCGWIAFA